MFTMQTNEYGTEILIKIQNGEIWMKRWNLTADHEFDYPWEPLDLRIIDGYEIPLNKVFKLIEEEYYTQRV